MYSCFSGPLDHIDDLYRQKLKGCYAESTKTAFRIQCKGFTDFMEAHKLPVFPPNVHHVARYLTIYSTRVTAYGSVANVLSSIKRFYSYCDYKLDVSAPAIDLLMKALRRQMSQSEKPKAPITPGHLVLIASLLDASDPTDIAFYAAMLIQFFSLVRKSNLLPPSFKTYSRFNHLSRRDIKYKDGNLYITLKWTKTLQNKDNVFVIPIASNKNGVLNPVDTYLDFVNRFHVPDNFPAFSLYMSKKLYVLTQNVYVQKLKFFMSKLNLPVSMFSSHSLRRGGASCMFQSQVPVSMIKAHGTWRSDCYQRYLSFNNQQKLEPTKKMFSYINSMFS